MGLHEWQKIAAEKRNPSWHGDLHDDCTARWVGLTLRAEWMQDDENGSIWWWAVTDDETGNEVDSSNNYLPGEVVRSGRDARRKAESIAYRWMVFLNEWMILNRKLKNLSK